MERKFKVGDRVKFVEDKMSTSLYPACKHYSTVAGLQENKIYIVSDTRDQLIASGFFVKLEGKNCDHPEDIFELVVENVPVTKDNAVVGMKVVPNKEAETSYVTEKYVKGSLFGTIINIDSSNVNIQVRWENAPQNTYWYIGVEGKEIQLFIYNESVQPKPTQPMNTKLAITVYTEDEKDALIDHYVGLGWGTKAGKDPYEFEWDFNEDRSFSYHDKYSTHTNRARTADGYTIIPFSAFAMLKGIIVTPRKKNKSFWLSSDYTAIVNYKASTVEVGCQRIPFSLIKEIYEATQA